ncbi:A/G-specific adenine glycosylase [Chakrabartyella piscis]|uniref:A/G-specific adenine glycosylase n=1 Tax=Chakrabartyella piscis TaxID=2918914 RepID=UPI0029587802|nr:A/G-specific adenine glycosylase [Chakrabartyella piscis]
MNQQTIDRLLQWYAREKRDLPWRRSKNPYHIWLSEIMLQQTRVEAVKPYYHKFLEELPTIEDLANVDEDVLMKLWEGLGYYSRVRNLQSAAKQIVADYGGSLPADYKELLKLKGIGTYTAGAIASIAFGLPQVAVDGNVLRVCARFYGDERDIALSQTKKEVELEWISVLPKEAASAFNQAIMEIGAMVCIPNGAPKCEVCPLSPECVARIQNKQYLYPVKSPKPERRLEELSVFFMVYNGKIAVHKRTEKGLLSGLWQLPNCNKEVSTIAQLQEWGIMEAEITNLKGYHHLFTHIKWQMDVYFVEVKELVENEFTWLTKEGMEQEFALPSAFKKAWIAGCNRIK